jgi:hypothetical protein
MQQSVDVLTISIPHPVSKRKAEIARKKLSANIGTHAAGNLLFHFPFFD